MLPLGGTGPPQTVLPLLYPAHAHGGTWLRRALKSKINRQNIINKTDLFRTLSGSCSSYSVCRSSATSEEEKTVPANLFFPDVTPSCPHFTCLHASLPVRVQAVPLGAGTHHVEGAAAVPAVLPAPAVLIPAFKLLCDGNTQAFARLLLRTDPEQRTAPSTVITWKKSRKKSPEISQVNRRSNL